MASQVSNATYKFGILAVEESLLTQNATAADTTLHVSGNYMTNAPFVVGNTYLLQDQTFASGSANALPNCEKVQVSDITGLTAVAKADGIGYNVSGTITILGWTGSAWSGGLVNSYATASSASVLTPGMEIAIQSSDFNCRFKTITDTPKYTPDDEASRFASGDEGRDLAIQGERTGEISFTEKMSYAGAGVLPKYNKIFRATGHLIKRYATAAPTGVGFLPSPYANETTATVWIITPENGMNPSSTIYRYRGCHGGNGCTIGWSKVGDVYMMNMKLSGAYVGTTEITVLKARELTSPDTAVPEVALNNKVLVTTIYGAAVTQPGTPYATVAALVTAASLSTGSRFYSTDGIDNADGSLATAKGSALKIGDAFTVTSSSTCTYASPGQNLLISSLSLDMGGVVNPLYDQNTTTGAAYFVTTDRDPKLTINPIHQNKTQDDLDFMVTNMIEGQIRSYSNQNAPHITIDIPRAQLTGFSKAAREGFEATNRTYKLNRNSTTSGNTGSGAMNSVLPDYAMYEILLGTRT